MEIPSDLIFEGSNVRIYFAENSYVNRTASSIVIEGTRRGFLSLANCLIYIVNSLEDEIELLRIPFVTSQVFLTIKIDESVQGIEYGIVSGEDDTKFVWKMSESDSNDVFTAIHSLGHLNSELHLDSGKAVEELSVYCVIS
jgi:hypothetical protein